MLARGMGREAKSPWNLMNEGWNQGKGGIREQMMGRILIREYDRRIPFMHMFSSTYMRRLETLLRHREEVEQRERERKEQQVHLRSSFLLSFSPWSTPPLLPFSLVFPCPCLQLVCVYALDEPVGKCISRWGIGRAKAAREREREGFVRVKIWLDG